MSEQNEQESNIVEFPELKFPPIEYGVTEAALADLAERYKEPDASTDEGYEHCKDGCRELTAVRTAIETRRKDLKAPAINWGRDVDKRAKDIVRRVKEIEAPVRAEKERIDEIKQTEARKAAEAEQQRVDGIMADIEQIAATAREQNIDATAADYQQHIKWLGALVISELSFAEFVDEANTARDAALFKFTQWHEQAVKREADDVRRKQEQAELDRQKKKLDKQKVEQEAEAQRIKDEQREADERKAADEKEARQATERAEESRKLAEENRIINIRSAIEIKRTIPNRASGSSSAALEGLITAEKAAEPTLADFDEFLTEAKAVWLESIKTLRIMVKNEREAEEKTRREEEARLPDKQKLVRWCDAIATITKPEVLNDKAQKILRRYGGDLSKLLQRLQSDIGKL